MVKLTRKMNLKLDGLEVGSTPMLLPSLSSRANLEIKKTLDLISEIVTGPILISAYDIHYIEDFPRINFPELIFIDSGGYECSTDKNASELGLYKPEANEWDEELYLKTVNEWDSSIPTVLVSYDHPSKRENLQKQILNAKESLGSKEGVLKELLLKAETQNSFLNIDNVVENLRDLNDFDIIGFTEKELGRSVLNCMENISRIRLEMEDLGLEIPIHVFGSLDTITTPLYYMSGADIFDGLSWLRFIFDDGTGNTSYVNSFGPKKEGIYENMKNIWIKSVYNNYTYLRKLEWDLKKFHYSKDFSHFGENKEFFEESYEYIKEITGGVL
ncbi:MAG: hypothetical protein AB3K77_03715 [Methanosarcinaceae archaeon]